MWEVVLAGDAADLRSLSSSFADGDPAILERDGEYVFRWSVLDGLSDVAQVKATADEQIARLSGSASLILGAIEPIKVAQVILVSDDGSRSIYGFPDPVVWNFRMSVPTVQIRKADGTVKIHRPADPVKAWLAVAESSEDVARALRLSEGREHDWVELYRLLEIVEASVTRKGITDAGWATMSQLKRFCHTANSLEAAGDAARHGREQKPPPQRPMTLNDARELIRRVVRQWLDTESQRILNSGTSNGS